MHVKKQTTQLCKCIPTHILVNRIFQYALKTSSGQNHSSHFKPIIGQYRNQSLHLITGTLFFIVPCKVLFLSLAKRRDSINTHPASTTQAWSIFSQKRTSGIYFEDSRRLFAIFLVRFSWSADTESRGTHTRVRSVISISICVLWLTGDLIDLCQLQIVLQFE